MWWSQNAPESIALNLGAIVVHWYGIIFVCAIAVGVCILWKTRNSNRFAYTSLCPECETYWDLFASVAAWVILGIIGARVYEVFFVSWDFFKDHLVHAWYIWEGGLAIHGGLLAVAGGLLLKYGKRAIDIFDWFAPAIAIGQGIGRWGNWFNQELYGKPFDGWWSVYIQISNRISGYESYQTFHPAFFYESVLLIALGFILIRVSAYEKRGLVAAAYVIGAGLIRFALEYIRIDPTPETWGLRLPQIVSLAMIVCGAVWIWSLMRKKSANA